MKRFVSRIFSALTIITLSTGLVFFTSVNSESNKAYANEHYSKYWYSYDSNNTDMNFSLVNDLEEKQLLLDEYLNKYSMQDGESIVYLDLMDLALNTNDSECEQFIYNLYYVGYSYYWDEGGCHLYICNHHDQLTGEYSNNPKELSKDQLELMLPIFQDKLSSFLDVGGHYKQNIREFHLYSTSDEFKQYVDTLFDLGYNFIQSEGHYFLQLCTHYENYDFHYIQDTLSLNNLKLFLPHHEKALSEFIEEYKNLYVDQESQLKYTDNITDLEQFKAVDKLPEYVSFLKSLGYTIYLSDDSYHLLILKDDLIKTYYTNIISNNLMQDLVDAHQKIMDYYMADNSIATTDILESKQYKTDEDFAEYVDYLTDLNFTITPSKNTYIVDVDKLD